MRKLYPREIRLLCISAGLACIVPFAPLMNSQLRHLRQVRAHVSSIRSEWNAFKSQNDGFELVEFFDYTGGDGMFGAYGYVPTEQHMSKLEAFLQSTQPPRPLYLKNVGVLDPESFDELKKRKGLGQSSSTTKQ